MKLRSRLAVTLVISVLPLAIAVALYQRHAHEAAARELVATQLVERMSASGRDACEAQPERWPRVRPRERRQNRERGPGMPPLRRIHAYDLRFESQNRNAPTLPAALRDALREEEVAIVASPSRPGFELVAVRMPWTEGPCAIVMAERPARPRDVMLPPALVPALVVSFAAVLVAVLAAGPVVRRTRRLIDRVREDGDAPIHIGGADELTELAAAFERRRAELRGRMAELEARDETLRSYVANTTHDVMIPLTVIQGHLSALEEAVSAGQSVDPDRLDAALEECHYLGSLVQNLSVAAKLEAGAPHTELHTVDLVGLVERVVGRHRPFARQRHVSLDHAVPDGAVTHRGDVTLLEQAIGNLVHNAIRYNEANGHVAVVLTTTSPDFRLEVLDDGAGLSEQELRSVTDRGFRGDGARQRHPTGLGLGLAIVKDVAERHGLRLSFERPVEGGLRVVMEGPLEAA